MKQTKEYWDGCLERLKTHTEKVEKRINSLQEEEPVIAKKIIAKTGDTGARSELLVCADLLDKKYSVFRSVSPTTAFDLVAYRHLDKKLFRVEVKTSRWSGRNPKLVISSNNPENYDILALVCKDGEVNYIPDLNDLK
jgi:hypothetical protein